MEINLNTKILTLAGEPVLDADKPLTFAGVCINSLLADHREEVITGDDKLKRWQLVKRIDKATTTVTLSLEEAVLLKNLVARFYTPLVVGQFYELLEGEK